METNKTAIEVFNEVKLLPLVEQIRLERMINEWVLNYTLSVLGLTEVSNALEENSFEAGEYLESDTPSAYSGIWAGEERDLKQVRAEAWKRKK